ncbi:MAG: RNA polymerase sigma factor [Myxococcales bacterium]|nr:RNA polymerase sigma factor [Myxococcales bacterium]
MQSRRTSSNHPLSDIYVEHFAYVWRTLRRLGVAVRDAEDLAQEVFVVVHRRWASFDATRPVKPWLFGIAYNVMRDHRKRSSTRNETLEEQWDPRGSDPGYRAVEAHEIVYLALQSLPEDRRVVFVLYELDHVPMKAIGELLQIPTHTGYSRLRVARTEFRAAVEELGAVS